jgi:photosystem II stability/assembly factor-like uncharacterized protein
MAGYFPVLAHEGGSRLAAVFRTAGPHIGITATLATATSDDAGMSWTDPIEAAPRWNDVRNPAFGIAADGTWVLAYWKAAVSRYRQDPNGPVYASSSEHQWDVVAHFVVRSTDRGGTWSDPVGFRSNLCRLASPFGRILTMPDGGLLMSAYGSIPSDDEDAPRHAAVLLRSVDEGRTWEDLSMIGEGYNETSCVRLPDGTLVAALRSVSGHVAVCHSNDAGESWSPPVQVTRDGEHPADLTLLHSGALLLTYGRRIHPKGCGALVSSDGGRTWDQDREVLLAGDGGHSSDIGYPSTVQLPDGRIVTALYYAEGSAMALDGNPGGGRITCEAIHYREEDLLP